MTILLCYKPALQQLLVERSYSVVSESEGKVNSPDVAFRCIVLLCAELSCLYSLRLTNSTIFLDI